MGFVRLIVNGEAAPQGALESEVNGLMARFKQLSAEDLERHGFSTPEDMQRRALEWASENVVERMLLRQEALKDKEPVAEEILQNAVAQAYERFGGKEKFIEAGLTEEEARQDAEAEIKIERLINTLTAKIKPAKQKEVADYYRKHRQDFVVPESVNAAHILKPINEEITAESARKAIEEVKAELDAGADFAEVAAKASDGPSELGWFPRGKMVPRFDEAAFSLAPGQYSGIFKTTFGYHIVKVLDRRPENQAPLNEVRAFIERELHRQKQNAILEPFVDKLREKAAVEVLPADS